MVGGGWYAKTAGGAPSNSCVPQLFWFGLDSLGGLF